MNDLLPEEDLAALFLKDPATISDDEFARIIAHMRQLRSQFMIAEASGKSAPTKAQSRKTKPKIDIDLTTLDFEFPPSPDCEPKK